MAGGVVRVASKKVNTAVEIIIGAAFGIAGGAVWRAWHMSYKAGVDDYYKKYEAEQAAKSAA